MGHCRRSRQFALNPAGLLGLGSPHGAVGLSAQDVAGLAVQHPGWRLVSGH